jgi:hypothetical protein
MIELTEEQRLQLEGGKAVDVMDSETAQLYVVLRKDVYEQMLQDDQREQEAVLRYSMKQATKVPKENPY